MEKGLNQNFKQEFNPSEQVFKKNIIVIFFLIKAQETLLCQGFYSKSNAWLCALYKKKTQCEMTLPSFHYFSIRIRKKIINPLLMFGLVGMGVGGQLA